MGSTISARVMSGLRELAQVLVIAAMPIAAGCESGGVGDPCLPEDEYRHDFAGYAETEVNLERRSFQCETRVCLVNNFRGRVSCPYGQNVPELGEDGFAAGVTHAERCLVPGTNDEYVSVPVRPQIIERKTDRAVYCSCRCNGPDKDAAYCECPSGFVCEELVSDLGLGRDQLVGSYCVRSGTVEDNPTDLSTQDTCDFNTLDCGAFDQGY